MKISNIKTGMKVRVSKRLDISESRWGVIGEMRKMTDRICKVENLDSTAAYVKDILGHAYWFAPEDLTPVTITKKPSPVMFDPKNLEET